MGRAATARVDDEFSGRSAGRLPLILFGIRLRAVLRRPRDCLAAGLAGFATIAILVNALFMQSGPHPAPIFANKPAPVIALPTAPAAAQTPQRKAAEAKVEATRPRSDTI